jgi:hypothetical protein
VVTVAVLYGAIAVTMTTERRKTATP